MPIVNNVHLLEIPTDLSLVIAMDSDVVQSWKELVNRHVVVAKHTKRQKVTTHAVGLVSAELSAAGTNQTHKSTPVATTVLVLRPGCTLLSPHKQQLPHTMVSETFTQKVCDCMRTNSMGETESGY